MRVRLALVIGLALAAAGCFGAVSNVRSYFVLSGDPGTAPPEPLIPGLLRVRNMDAEAVYEKFQIVVRQSPYQLRYSELNVWAVKPNQMVSDIIAKTLKDTGAFGGVTRMLGDTRPDYVMSGDLHAIEIYDSDDVWFAHLAISLRLTRWGTGDRIWGFTYDHRKHVPTKSFAHAVRALSELLSAAVRQAVTELSDLGLRQGPPPPPEAEESEESDETEESEETEEAEEPPDEPIYVPERREEAE